MQIYIGYNWNNKYLVKKTISPIHSFLAILGLYYYSYFIHRAYHYIPEQINPHMIHHKNNTLTRVVNLTIECLTDSSFFVVLYFFQKLIGYELFPNILILYYGIIYVSVHIINFSIFGDENHKKHHDEKDKKYCNYAKKYIIFHCRQTCGDRSVKKPQ